MIKLWKFNKITGYWYTQRSCLPETSQEWLNIYQKDEPNEYFLLAKYEPKIIPDLK